jgi:hypothetical protein
VSNTLTAKFIDLIKAEEEIQFKSSSFLHFWESTQKLNALAQDFEILSRKTEEVWAELSQDDRNKLKELAYELANKDCDGCSNGWVRSGRLIRVFFFTPVKFFEVLREISFLIKKDKHRLFKFGLEYSFAKNRLQEARYQFVDTILNAIECDDPQYQQFLSDTLEELKGKVSDFTD